MKTIEGEEVYVRDFYYRLMNGPSLEPDLWVEPEDAERVKQAIDTLEEFREAVQGSPRYMQLP